MTIFLNPDQERAIQEAIQAGLIRSVDEFIGTAIEGFLTEPARQLHAKRPSGARRSLATSIGSALGSPLRGSFGTVGHGLQGGDPMTITVDIRPEVQAELARQAAAHGLAI